MRPPLSLMRFSSTSMTCGWPNAAPKSPGPEMKLCDAGGESQIWSGSLKPISNDTWYPASSIMSISQFIDSLELLIHLNHFC